MNEQYVKQFRTSRRVTPYVEPITTSKTTESESERLWKQYCETKERKHKAVLTKLQEKASARNALRAKVFSQGELTPSQQEYYSRLGTGRYSWNTNPVSELPEAPGATAMPKAEEQAVRELYLNEHKKRLGVDVGSVGVKAPKQTVVTPDSFQSVDDADIMWNDAQSKLNVATQKLSHLTSDKGYTDRSALLSVYKDYNELFPTVDALLSYYRKNGNQDDIQALDMLRTRVVTDMQTLSARYGTAVDGGKESVAFYDNVRRREAAYTRTYDEGEGADAYLKNAYVAVGATPQADMMTLGENVAALKDAYRRIYGYAYGKQPPEQAQKDDGFFAWLTSGYEELGDNSSVEMMSADQIRNDKDLMAVLQKFGLTPEDAVGGRLEQIVSEYVDAYTYESERTNNEVLKNAFNMTWNGAEESGGFVKPQGGIFDHLDLFGDQTPQQQAAMEYANSVAGEDKTASAWRKAYQFAMTPEGQKVIENNKAIEEQVAKRMGHTSGQTVAEKSDYFFGTNEQHASANEGYSASTERFNTLLDQYNTARGNNRFLVDPNGLDVRKTVRFADVLNDTTISAVGRTPNELVGVYTYSTAVADDLLGTLCYLYNENEKIRTEKGGYDPYLWLSMSELADDIMRGNIGGITKEDATLVIANFNNYRKGSQNAEEFHSDFTRVLGRFMLGAIQGLESVSFDSLSNVLEGKKSPTSVASYTDNAIRESFESKAGQVISDISSGLGGMATYLPLNYIVGPGAGMAMMGTQVFSRNAQTALNDGHSYGEALVYGITTAASELALEKLLDTTGNAVGGSVFGNMLSKGIGSVASKLSSNSFLRKLLSFGLTRGAGFVSEVIEESSQSIADTVLQAGVLDENVKIDFEAVGYEGLIAGLIGAILGGNVNASTFLDGTPGANIEVLRGMNEAALELDLIAEERQYITEATDTAIAYFENGSGSFEDVQSAFEGIANVMRSKAESYRVIAQEDATDISQAELEEFRKAKLMKEATSKDLTEAEKAVDSDSAAVRTVHAERAQSDVKYTPPRAKDVKTYSTEETKAYSRALSRKVYLYDGASHPWAEAGFAENGAVYINTKAPVNRNTVAVVLAHEYIHTTERQWNKRKNKYVDADEYIALKKAVFKSDAYNNMLRSRGMTQREYLNEIISDYDGLLQGDPTKAAEKEAVARFMSEYVLQDVNVLIDLARTDRNVFQRAYTQFRRFIARLSAKSANHQDLYKLERLFAKAAKASNKATQTQKSPATSSGAQYMAYIGDTKDGRRCYESGFDSSVSMDVRVAEFKKKISTIFNLGAVELKTDVKKIKIKADKFTFKKNLYGAEYESRTEYELKISALFDLADILSTAVYDPVSTAQEPSYADPTIKPKNDAHKGVKYWYKFRNEIVFDGVPFTVTFNIRDKGAEQYQYLIEFKENKALGINNTVAKSNLLQTRQAPYKSIIPDSSGKSNPQYSLPSRPVSEPMTEQGYGEEAVRAFRKRAGVEETYVTQAELEEFRKATLMKEATAEDLTEAAKAVDSDSAAVRTVHAERAQSNVKYTPPRAKDVKTYSTEETKAYSRALSRKVYFYDGASHAWAEAGFAENGAVYINTKAPVNRNTVAVVLAHEYVHTIEGTEAYTKLADAVFKSNAYNEMVRGTGMTKNEYLQQIISDYARRKVTIDEDGAKREAIAAFMSEYVLQDVNVLIDLARTDRTWFGNMYARFRRFIARLSAKSANHQDLYKLERLFAKAAKASHFLAQTQKSPATESGVQYSLNITHSDGMVEVLLNARDITEEHVEHYLELAKKGKLEIGTYIPVRKDTPLVLINSLAGIGEMIENRSLVMQVNKARRAMGRDGGNRAPKRHGSNVRKHGLSIPQILEILRNLDNPTTLVKQTNRVDKDGKPLPDNFAVFVEYKNGDAEALAVVEFDASFAKGIIGEEFGDTQFHTVVTLLEPDIVRDGMPFDYLVDEVLENPNNIEVEIVREPPTRNTIGKIHPSTPSELLSKYSIPDSPEKSNPQYSLPSRPVSEPMTEQGYAEEAVRAFRKRAGVE